MKHLLPTLQLDKALAADEAWNKDATLLVSTDEVTVLQTSCKFNIGQDKHIRAITCEFQQCGHVIRHLPQTNLIDFFFN